VSLFFLELAVWGIGVHHAGLSLDDRRAVENLFLSKQLKVVVATSTLAVGVNLRKIFNKNKFSNLDLNVSFQLPTPL
jgi:superfamily II RNA helicase